MFVHGWPLLRNIATPLVARGALPMKMDNIAAIAEIISVVAP
jgi:hypothetical protein